MLTRQEILLSQVPLIFKNILTWKQKNWSIEEWMKQLGTNGDKYTFREGSTKCSKEPLWERNCETKLMSMKEFFDKFSNPCESDNWIYFDYKHIAKWFSDVFKDITWECVGFPDRNNLDSTLWIGTEGAYTPCHMDTYGCNLVAQLYGRKMWLLFEPSSTNDLSPTRVPYEESNIKVRCIILEPGDVLFIPKHWWHYVENVTSAISINTWIPMESDDESRLEESLVKCFISSIIQKLDFNEVIKILNPNETDLIELKSSQLLNELKLCIQRTKNEMPPVKPQEVIYDIYFDYLIPVNSLQNAMKNLKKKCKLTPEANISINNNLSIEHIINAFCHPGTISIVREKLLKEVSN